MKKNVLGTLIGLELLCIVSYFALLISFEKNLSNNESWWHLLAFVTGLALVIWSVVELKIEGIGIMLLHMVGFSFAMFFKAVVVPLGICMVEATSIKWLMDRKYIKHYVSDDAVVNRWDIVCIKDNFQTEGKISGSFIYISGSMHDNPVYTFYYRGKDGGIKQNSISSKYATIYESADNTAYIEKWQRTYYDLNTMYDPPKREDTSDSTWYKIFVPKGSVKNEYVFDAE